MNKAKILKGQLDRAKRALRIAQAGKRKPLGLFEVLGAKRRVNAIKRRIGW